MKCTHVQSVFVLWIMEYVTVYLNDILYLCIAFHPPTRSAGGSLIQHVTLNESCCGNASFTVGSPVMLLNGSVEVVGGYIYQTEGSSCDLADVRANISIREGMLIGTVPCKWP